MTEPIAEPTDARRRWMQTWASRAGLLAVVVIAVQLGWRAIVLGQGFFSQDDFVAMATVSSRDGLAVLTGDYAGGFSPGGSTVVDVLLAIAPLSWTLAAAVVLTLQTAATAMLWVVLTQLLGERWLRIPVLVLFAFSPLTLWSTQWFVLGVEFWSATLFLLVAAWAVIGAVRTGDRRRGAVAVLAVALALAFDERAFVHPVVLVGVAVLAAPGSTLRERLAHGVGRHLATWLAMVLVLGGYLGLRWQYAPIRFDFGDQLGEIVTDYLRHSVAEVLGGPWTGQLPAHAFLVPHTWSVGLSGILVLGLIGLTLRHGGLTARISWATLVVFLGSSIGVLALTGRAEALASIGLVPRFGAELAPVAALCIAGALSQVELPDLSARGRWWSAASLERLAAGGASVLLVVSAGFSTAFLAGNLFHEQDKEYVDALRAALRADPQTVLLDGGVPDTVISTWYGDRARVSSVVGYAPEDPVFDLPSHTLRMVREDGTLAPVVLEGAVRTAVSDDEQCGYPVRASGTLVPMQGEVPPGRWVLRIGYYTSADGFAEVLVAGSRQRFAVRSGLQAVDVVVNGGFTNFRMTLDDPVATLCLTDASAGVPTPGPR